MSYDSSDIEYREPVCEKEGERLFSLAQESVATFPNRKPGKIQTPVEFLKTMQNIPSYDGSKLFFIVNSEDSQNSEFNFLDSG